MEGDFQGIVGEIHAMERDFQGENGDLQGRREMWILMGRKKGPGIKGEIKAY